MQRELQRRLGWRQRSLTGKKIWRCGIRKKWIDHFCSPFLISAWGLRLEAILATSITHPNLWQNCWWLSCIVGNVGGRFGQGRRTSGIKKRWYLWFCWIDFDSFFFFFFKLSIMSHCSRSEMLNWVLFYLHGALHVVQDTATNLAAITMDHIHFSPRLSFHMTTCFL